MVSKAFLKSINIAPTVLLSSNAALHLSVTHTTELALQQFSGQAEHGERSVICWIELVAFFKYSHNFLLSLQSYSLIPTIDKPTRVYRNSATLIDNILVNNVKGTVSSGNVVSDVSDHFTQFCIFHSCKNKISPPRQKIRHYSRFSESLFHYELSQIEWDSIITDNQNDIDRTFSNFFNTLNKLVKSECSQW